MSMQFRLAHYEIDREIGHGGMGVVYRARDTRLGRLLAIKVLPSLLRSDPERRGRFVREARAAAALNHPNIATIYEVGEAVLEPVARQDDSELTEPQPTTCLYIAMELVPGKDLHDLLTEEPLPVTESLDLAIQIADALDTAHRAGIIHRDLKPRNIRLTPEGRIKILDFGLAKVLQEDAGVGSALGAGTLATPGDVRTIDGMIVGTVPYMAPEQVEGRDVDARSDLFAFGVVLYQMLAGQVPFAGPGLVQYVRALGSGPPDPPSAHNDAVPVEIDRVALRLLAKESGERYASAGALLEDLRSLVGSDVSTSHSPTRSLESTPIPETRSIREAATRSVWVPRLIGAVVVVALLAVIAWFRTAPSSARTVELLPFTSRAEASLPSWCTASETEIRRAFLDRDDNVSLLQAGIGGADADLVIEGDCQVFDGQERLYVIVKNGKTGEIVWDELLEPRGGISIAAAKEVAYLLQRTLRTLDAYETEMGLAPSVAFEAARSYLLGVRRLERALEPADFGSIVDHFDQALRHAGEHAAAHARVSEAIWWAWRGLGLEERERFREEVAAAVSLESDSPESLIAKSRLQELEGALAESVASARRAAEIAPRNAWVLHQLGWRLRRAGQIEAARDAFLMATRLRPGFWRYWNDLGSLLRNEFGELIPAKNAYSEAYDLSPAEAIWPVENLTAVALDLGDLPLAEKLLSSVPESLHTGSFAHALGRYHAFTQEWQDSLASFKKAVRLEPDNVVFQINLAESFLRNRKEVEARQYLHSAEEALSAALSAFDQAQRPALSREADWLAFRAFTRALSSECDGALEDAVQAAEALPTTGRSSTGYFFAGGAFEICGQHQDALEMLVKSVALGTTRREVTTSIAFDDNLTDAELARLFPAGSSAREGPS